LGKKEWSSQWAEGKTAEGQFEEVRAYDSNDLEHWLLDAPAVGLWLTEQIGKRIQGQRTSALIGEIGKPPLKKELPPEVLLTNQQGTIKALAEWLAGNPELLAIQPFRVIGMSWSTCAEMRSCLCDSRLVAMSLADGVAPSVEEGLPPYRKRRVSPGCPSVKLIHRSPCISGNSRCSAVLVRGHRHHSLAPRLAS
jgi:hypothetical protein